LELAYKPRCRVEFDAAARNRMGMNMIKRVWSVVLAALVVSTAAFGQAILPERPALGGALTLSQAIETGLRENLRVRVALEEQAAARAGTRAMQAMTRPQLSATAYAKIGDMETIMPSAPGVMPGNLALLPPRAAADLNLTAMAPIFTGGFLGSRVRAASEQQRAAGAEVEAMRVESAMRIREAYYGALLQAEMTRAEQARIDAAREMIRATRARFEAGKDIEASVQRAEAELADAERERAMRENERAKMILNLLTEMGARLDSEVTLADSLRFEELTQDLAAYLAEAQRARPELVSARARLAAAEAQVKAAEATRRPQLYGMAMLDGFASREMSGGLGYTLGAVASLPLFDAGQRRAEIDQARAMRNRSGVELGDLELRVGGEVRQAMLDVGTAARNYSSALAAVRAAESAYETVRLRVEVGRSILVEQLDALAALTRARASLAQALFDHSLARARLLRAVGRVQ
jgi:outer membrane protein TolC